MRKKIEQPYQYSGQFNAGAATSSAFRIIHGSDPWMSDQS